MDQESRMAATEAAYCNHCGTANPPRAAVCCKCGHVHAREMSVLPEKTSTAVVEQWFWTSLKIVCGIGICLGGVVPISGAPLDTKLLGSVLGALAIPVLIAAVLGNGDWARSSRWFLGAALLVPIMHYLMSVFARIHLK